MHQTLLAVAFIRYEPIYGNIAMVIHDNFVNRMASADGSSLEFLTYQLLTVRYWLTVALTGNGELGFDSGEGA